MVCDCIASYSAVCVGLCLLGNEATPALTCQIGTRRACETPSSCLDLMNQLTASASPCTHAFSLECWFTSTSSSAPTLSPAPLFVLFSQRISESHIIRPNCRHHQEVLAHAWDPQRLPRDSFMEPNSPQAEGMEPSFSNEFCLSTFGLKLYMCLTFLRTRHIQGCYPLSKKWKYVLI